MDDPGSVHGVDGIGDLADDLANFFRRQWNVLLGVFFEELAERPLDGEEMYAGSSFAYFDRSHHVGMRDSSAVCCFPEKPCNCSLVGPQLLFQHFDSSDAMDAVLGAVDHCRSTLTNHILQRVSGECSTGKI